MSQGVYIKKTALIVEDEPILARSFKKILAEDGFIVDTAADGNIACSMVMQEAFDLCILNLHLPGMNGMEFYRFLQHELPGLSFNTLFTTGDVLSGETETFLKDSGQPFLLKPFTPDELRTAVGRMMHQAE